MAVSVVNTALGGDVVAVNRFAAVGLGDVWAAAAAAAMASAAAGAHVAEAIGIGRAKVWAGAKEVFVHEKDVFVEI